MIELFECGFGTTIGNSLRRILLSSLEGSAVESIKISGVDHEFTSIPGVMEDVTDIVLNVKKPCFDAERAAANHQGQRSKTGPVTAGMIKCDPPIEIINKDLVLATLTDNVKFEMEMAVGSGRGYSPAAERIAEADRFDQEADELKWMRFTRRFCVCDIRLKIPRRPADQL